MIDWALPGDLGVEVTKHEILLRKMRKFRELLAEEARSDAGLQVLLVDTSSLFNAIEAGDVLLPREGLFASPIQGEGVKYGYPHPLYSAASDFICALEEWPSKTWWTGPKTMA